MSAEKSRYENGPRLVDLLNHCIGIAYPRTELFIMDAKQLSKLSEFGQIVADSCHSCYLNRPSGNRC